MKVAAVYTGLARTFKDCIPNHQISFWKKYNITDCYFHFWHEDNVAPQNSAPWSHGTMPEFVTTRQDILDVFKPKKFLLEPERFPVRNKKLQYPYKFDEFTKDEILHQCIAPVKSNALSIRRAYELIKDTDYDYYVLGRSDMLWNPDLNAWPNLNGIDNYYYWDTLWIFRKGMFELFSEKVFKINEYVHYLLENQKDHETQDYHFLTSEAINDTHFKMIGVNYHSFVSINMPKMIHRGTWIQH